jgi:hypothetical protein
MIQREVQDSENVTWSCVQALSGLSGEAARHDREDDPRVKIRE